MQKRNPYLHPRDEIMEMMQRIYRYDMTTTSGGNISLRDEDGSIWITPARVDKGNLKREDIICVKSNGEVVGPHPPSSEFPFHKAIYEARPELKGVVHAHPVALVAFSINGKVPNSLLFHQTHKVCGNVGFAPYALPGSDALADEIAKAFTRGDNCVVLENHGVVVGGESVQNAFQRFETLEFAAKTIIKASSIGEIRYLKEEDIQLPRKGFTYLPEFDPPTPTGDEKELRKELCAFSRRGYEKRLVISTEGSFSARLDDTSFLITPYKVDRNTLELADIVLVKNGARERGKYASRAARNHRAIYDQNPDVKAIVNAYTVHASAFGVTDRKLDSRTIPESYIFLKDIQRIPYGAQFNNPEALAETFSMDQPIALLENDGMMVCGRSILDAFDRLEVLETTAEAILNSMPLGPLTPMPDEVIDELNAAFSV